MDRNEFRSRLKQYKEARELNPLLKYWEWKDIPKYEDGTHSVQSTNIPLWRQKATPEQLEVFWQGDTQKMADIAEKLRQRITYTSPLYTLDEVVVSAKDPNKYNELDLAKDIAGFTPIGDVIDVYDASKALINGNYALAAMLGAGLLLPNWLEKSGKLVYKGIKNNVLAYGIAKNMDSAKLNKFSSLSKPNTIEYTPSLENIGPYVDYQMADMRNFLKTKFNKWTKRYGYDPIPLDLSIRESMELMKDRLTKHNTFVRGVRDPELEYIKYSTGMGAYRAKQMKNAIDNANARLLQHGLEQTPQNRMEFAASTLVGDTGHGRAGKITDDGLLYTSNSLNTAGGYASIGNDISIGGVFEVQRPLDFSGDYKNWILKNEFPLLSEQTAHITDDRFYTHGLPYLMKTGRSLLSDVNKLISQSVRNDAYRGSRVLTIGSHILDSSPKEIIDRYQKSLQKVDKLMKLVFPNVKPTYKRFIDIKDPLIAASQFKALAYLEDLLKYNRTSEQNVIKDYYRSLNLITKSIKQRANKEYARIVNSLSLKIIDDLMSKESVKPIMDFPDGFRIFTTEKKHFAPKSANAYQHFIFSGTVGDLPVSVVRQLPKEEWITIRNKNRSHTGKSDNKYSRKSYAEGGQVEPADSIDPVDMYNRTRYQVNGVPINDQPVSGTDPVGETIMWGLGGGAASAALRKIFPTYGAMAGWLAFGDNGKENMLVIPSSPTKKRGPIAKDLVNQEVKDYYANDVIPRDVVHTSNQSFITDGNFMYDILPEEEFNSGVAGYYNKLNDKIAINNRYAGDKKALDDVMAHEVDHLYNNQYPLDKQHNNILNRAYTVQDDDISRAARAARKESEKRATNKNVRYGLYTELKERLGRTPSIKEVDEYIDSIPDLELLDRLYRANSYGAAYVMSIEDRAELLKAPINQYKKTRATLIRKALKLIAMNESNQELNYA